MVRVINSVIRVDGVIHVLCSSEDYWSPQAVSRVVSDIEGHVFSYWIEGTTMCYKVVVKATEHGLKTLTITDDTEIALDELPEYKIPAMAS